MRKRRLSAVLALMLALSMSFSSFAGEMTSPDTEAETSVSEEEDDGSETSAEEEAGAEEASEEEETVTEEATEEEETTEEEVSVEEDAVTEEASGEEEETAEEASEEETTGEETSEEEEETVTEEVSEEEETAEEEVSEEEDAVTEEASGEEEETAEETSEEETTGEKASEEETAEVTFEEEEESAEEASEEEDAVTEEVSEEEEESEEIGEHVHEYEDSWSWSDDYASAEVTLTCTDEDCTEDTDGHTVTLGMDDGIEITSETTGAVTDEDGGVTEAGYITYTAAVIYNEEEYTDSVVISLEEDEAEEESACAAGEYEATTDGGTYVSLEWDEGAFTGDPEVEIEDLDEETALANAEEALEDEDVTILKAYGVDITFYVDGEEEEPASAVRVSVEFNSDTASDADEICIVHKHDGRDAVVLDESAGNVEELDVTVKESSDTVTVDLLLDEFSSITEADIATVSDDDETTTQTEVYVNSSTVDANSSGCRVLVLTESVSNTTYYVREGAALAILGGSDEDGTITFENCTFVITGTTMYINGSGVGYTGETTTRLGIAGNVTFENCTFEAANGLNTTLTSTGQAGNDAAIEFFDGTITFENSTITGTGWDGQFMGLYGSADVTFNNCKVSTVGNMDGWSYAMYDQSVWTMNDSTLKATGEILNIYKSNINCFYSGDLNENYDAITFTNSYVKFTDNQAGGFAINSVNIHVTDSTIIVSNNLGNACNSGKWYVESSTIEMNGNRGGHALSCIGFWMTNSTLEILHNGYAGVYITQSSSLTNCTVDIRCNGENSLSYTAGDTWIGRGSTRCTLTVTNCTSNALEGSAWLGAVGRRGYIITEGCSVVAFDLNELADDNVKSSTEAILTSSSSSATVALSDTNDVLANVVTSSLTNGTDYNALLGEDEHILLLNPWMTSDYARGNGENTSSDNDADLFDDDNNLSGDYASDYILNKDTAKIGTLTTAQLSHHIYDFDTIVTTVEATSTTYGYAAYACVDVCADYADNTEEHTWSYDCDGTYVYAPLVGLHFEANAYDDDGNDVSDTVEGMPDDQTTITFSGTAEAVSDPTREGYVFAGWYLDEDCTEEFDFSTNLNECWTVVYAKWVKATTVTVTKTWDDQDDAYALRSGSVTVELFADGVATGLTAELSEDNDWEYTFEGIVAYSDDDETTAVAYTVVETSVAGYETSYSEVTGNVSDGWSVEVTNSLITVDVTVSKVWDDSDDADGLRPDSVTVELYADGKATGKTVELSAGNGWTAAFEKLAAYAYNSNGELCEVSYSVVEVAVNGYDAEQTGVSFTIGSLEVEITNTHEVVSTSVSVTKIWNDSHDAKGLRPDSVTVELYADGVATGNTVTLSGDNDWAAVFNNLAAYTYDSDGNASEITYSVAEELVDGYTTEYSDVTGNASDGYYVTITNTLEGTPVIAKSVSDTENGTYTDSVSAAAGSAVYYEASVTATDTAHGYVLHDTMSSTLSFASVLGVYVDGAEVDSAYYTVSTDTSDGCTFEVTISDDYVLGTLEGGETITVRYTAVLSSDAASGVDYPNTVYLEYDDPYYWSMMGTEVSMFTEEDTAYVSCPEAEEETSEPETEEPEEETEEETEGETEAETTTTAETAATSMTTGALAIIKVDAETGARLAGATFALYNDTEGTLIGYYKTDSNGYLVTSQLTLNYTYSFVEVGAPEGYVLDSTPHTVLLTSSLSSSADTPYVLTISNTAETAVLSAEVEAAEIVANEEEAGSVLAETREGVASTGDDSNVMFWLILMLAAGGALGGLTVLAKKRRNA